METKSIKLRPAHRRASVFCRVILQSQILQSSWGRSFRKRFSVLQLLHDYLNGFVQLLVNALLLFDRVVINKDIRVYTVVLNNPLAGLGVVVGEEWYAYVGAVHVWKRSADTYNTSPSAGTDNGAKVVGLEAPWEQVSV